MSAIRGVVRNGQVEVNLPDGTEVMIVPEAAAAALSPAEIAAVVASMPPFEWTSADETEWQAEKANRASRSNP